MILVNPTCFTWYLHHTHCTICNYRFHFLLSDPTIIFDLIFLFNFFPQEEELRKSGEAKYAHLSNDLHVLIEAFAPPGEAYSRMSYALEEIKKFLVPVSSFKPFHLLKFLQGNCELYIQMGLCTSALVDSSTGAFFALSDVIESLQG